MYGIDTNIQLKITDEHGTPIGGAQAKAALVMTADDSGKTEVSLVDKGNGIYEGTGQFSMAGEWKILILAYAQGKLGQQTFPVVVQR